jgi:hypothetical protein
MNAPTQKCLQTLIGITPVIDRSVECLVSSWSPETPPVTVVFSQIGDAIADHLVQMPTDVQQALFAEIERGMCSQDVDLRTAVATGLIEALVGKSDKQPGLFAQLEKLFGPASTKHALEWQKFGQQGAGTY